MSTESTGPHQTPSEKIVGIYGIQVFPKSGENGDIQSMMDMEYSVAAVESIIMYTFNDKKLLEQALTHSSYTDGPSYHRLEFLGDSAIGLAISSLYIDCGFNLQLMWMIVRRLLEPLVTIDVILARPQPITTLYGTCKKDGKKVDIQYWKNGDRNHASVFVDNAYIASGSSDSKQNAKLHAAEAALLKIPKSNSGDTSRQTNLDFNEFMEIEGAKLKLHGLCNKKKWPKPTYRVEQELGPTYDKRYISSIQVELSDTILILKGNERSRVKDAENSAASVMFCASREAGYT